MKESKVLFEAKEIDVDGMVAKAELLSLEDKAKLYRACKAKRALIKRYDDDLKAIENATAEMMGAILEEQNIGKVTFPGVGTIYRKSEPKVSVKDQEVFFNFVYAEATKSMEENASPIGGFSFISKSPAQRVLRDFLETKAKESLDENPYAPGSLEGGLPYEEQLLLRMKEEAPTYGVTVFEDVKTSVTKN